MIKKFCICRGAACCINTDLITRIVQDVIFVLLTVFLPSPARSSPPSPFLTIKRTCRAWSQHRERAKTLQLHMFGIKLPSPDVGSAQARKVLLQGQEEGLGMRVERWLHFLGNVLDRRSFGLSRSQCACCAFAQYEVAS